MDFYLIKNGEDGQLRYKFVGFAYLVLNLGPYLVDFSQTLSELLVLKGFQDRNWNRKSKLKRFCMKMIISPVGPFLIFVKKLLRLVQGVSNLSIELAEMGSQNKFQS